MNLTPAQLQTLKTWLDTNAAGVPDEEAAALLNAPAAPAFHVKWSAVPVTAIKDAINWKKLTSNASIPAASGNNATDQTAYLLFLARRTACSDLVLNLQTILGLAGGGTLDGTRANIVQGLRDSLEAVPSLANGTAQDAGWAAVQPLLARAATAGEKLFASGDGSGPTTPATLGTGSDGRELAGDVTTQNVSEARNLP